ncbi:MAG: SPOR domain-containing protein, partial [Alphaproteobacteria bacterium]|nr:SPOR domain-containing protein [Alphaproteobacteria bacterium]
ATEHSRHARNYRGRLASLGSTLENSSLSELMGQGDYDADQAKRIETGMIAIAAHTGQSLSAPKGPILRTDSQLSNPVSMASFAPPLPQRKGGDSAGSEKWAIQIGAFTSRVATDQAIKKTQSQLPAQYASAASPIIVPLRTQEGWLFRGRLSGFDTEEQAAAACKHIKDCLPVSPYE